MSLKPNIPTPLPPLFHVQLGSNMVWVVFFKWLFSLEHSDEQIGLSICMLEVHLPAHLLKVK